MIRKMCLGLALLLCLCGVTAALAETDDVIKVQCPDDFTVQSVDMSKDGALLLAGYVGTMQSSKPLLMSVDARGEVLWMREGESKLKKRANFYRVAKYLEDGSVAALLTAKNDRWVMQYLKDDQLQREVKQKGDVFGIYPTRDGYMQYSTPKIYFPMIERMGLDGKASWSRQWDENIDFEGVLEAGDGYVAFGNKSYHRDDVDPGIYSVVMALDGQGEVLWRHNGPEGEQDFAAGAATGDGHVVIAGHVERRSGLPVRDADAAQSGAFLAEYDEGGEVWRTYFENERGGRYGAHTKIAVLPVRGGYLCALGDSERDCVRMQLVDAQGDVQQAWDASIGDVQGIRLMSLFEMNGNACLVVSGNRRGVKGRARITTLSTVINEVDMPE